MKTAAVYARYSNDRNQKDRSIEDQVAMARDLALREGYEITEVFEDRGKTSATLAERDGILDLLERAERRVLPEVLIVESLDRVSRDREDLAGFHKRLVFAGTIIHTLNEGIATDLHVGVRGITGPQFMKDLAKKVRRGHNGRVREGLIPGSIKYGYRRVLGPPDADGRINFMPGVREIDPEQAKVVVRIFTEYAAGISPRAIAAGLTRDGIPSPTGGIWNHNLIIGGELKNGMIKAPIYVGIISWNRSRTHINPFKRKRVQRVNNDVEEPMLTVDAPHLRIVPQALWEAANKVCADRSVQRWGTGKRRQPIPRRQTLFAGLLQCGTCGGHMRITNTSGKMGRHPNMPRFGCAAAFQQHTCEHSRSYDIEVIESLVIPNLTATLLDPSAIERAQRRGAQQWAARAKEEQTNSAGIKKKLNSVRAQIERLIALAGATKRPIKALSGKLEALDAERVGLEESLRLAQANNNVLTLPPPKLLDAYKRNVARLAEVLQEAQGNAASEAARIVARAAVRNVVERIVVHAVAKKQPYEVSVYGRAGALYGVDLLPKGRSAAEMLATSGISLRTNGKPAKAGFPEVRNDDLICFGRWRQDDAA